MLDLIYDCDRVDTLVSTQPSTQSGPVAVLWPNWQDPGKMSPLSFHLRYTQSHTHTCSRMGTTVWSRYWRVGSPCRSCFTRLLLVPDPLLVPSLLLEVSSSNDLFVPSELTPDTTPADSGITQSWLMLKTKSIIVNIGLFYLRTWWLQPGFSRAADRGGRGG